MGAVEIGVIELSVGAGLVTVLFVLAISIAGDQSIGLRSIVPKPLAIALVIVAIAAGVWMIWPTEEAAPAVELSLSQIHWQDRGLDTLLQVILIFAGALGLMGLLAGERVPAGIESHDLLHTLDWPALPSEAETYHPSPSRPSATAALGRALDAERKEVPT
jgi:hypothetical protein